MIQKEYFKSITTKELLSFRRGKYCRYPRFEGDGSIGYCEQYEIDRDSLYEELSERPHVATGKEAKLLRKLKAEHKMSEEEIRKNPDYRKMLAEAQKSETTYSKTKKKELHYLVKKICKETNLHPDHPKVKELILKSLEETPLWDSWNRKEIENRLKTGDYYI